MKKIKLSDMFKIKRSIALLTILVTLLVSTGCVYYNTFYNARKAFNEAEENRKRVQYNPKARFNKGAYTRAIEKSLKVVENNPNSKWYDDALYILGVSYFYTDQYNKAERRFREILVNYGDSKFSKESEVYLAKTKLKLLEEEEAMEIFEKIFNSDFDKKYKAEAAMGLGTFYYNEKNYEQSKLYFQAVRDSLGSSDEKKIAQRYIADSYFNRFQFKDALSSYLQILGMEPDKDEKYHAYFQSSVCSYNLMRINDGMNYLKELMNDELYYDSLGVFKSQIALGYEYEDDIELAEEIYLEIVNEEKNRRIAGQAYYRLGLIYQFDYDKLVEAKEYFDKTVEFMGNSEIGQDALERSSNIGKLNTFARTLVIDSTTTQEKIDEAAYTQFQLSELYWFNLNKPDTAMIEMQYIIDSFPASYDAPAAYISLSQMYREYKSDTATADSLLWAMIDNYPKSDFIEDALDVLGLKGTPSDTGYAKAYLDQAEKYLIDEENLDSARYYYNYIIDHFPESDYYLQARFALIWMTENYESPGDSSIVFAYQEFIDSFPGTYWATEARNKVRYQPKKQVEDTEMGQNRDSIAKIPEGEGPKNDSALAYMDPLDAVYYDPEGKKIELMPLQPTETRKPFEYPTEAYTYAWEGDLYFQILLDFSGEVIDYKLKIKCESEDINREAEETVASMIFDALRIPAELQDSWWVYKYRVYLPDHLR